MIIQPAQQQELGGQLHHLLHIHFRKRSGLLRFGRERGGGGRGSERGLDTNRWLKKSQVRFGRDVDGVNEEKTTEFEKEIENGRGVWKQTKKKRKKERKEHEKGIQRGEKE
jgi:hypothetical protein